MAETKIEWCDYTFNPWRGCTKISPGCANCYAETMSHRNPAVLGVWGDKGTRVVAAESYWKLPLKWDRQAVASKSNYDHACLEATSEYDGVEPYHRPRVFCASLADVFEDRPELIEPRKRLFRLIHQTPNLDWLLLTKRPELIAKAQQHFADEIDTYEAEAFSKVWMNRVWIGVSVEDQRRADERIPHLLRTPAAVRFLSVEPMLGPVDLTWWIGGNGGLPEGGCADKPNIHWIIVGGESGHGARPCSLTWVRSIVAQCKEAGVACFVKQLGANITGLTDSRGLNHDAIAKALGSTYRLRDTKGGDMTEWPEILRVREFPTVTP